MIRLRLHSIALLGPGLNDWQHGQVQLRDEMSYEYCATVVPPAVRLPATERRRVGLSVKVAMAVADQLFAHSSFTAADTATLFTSSGGDGENCHILCDALDTAVPSLSPTRFTNSVHNAPSGYWSIAAASTRAATTLCAFDASFSAGLIEAAVYASYEREPIALIAYDVPYPEPIHSKRPISAPFGVALLLSAGSTVSPGTMPLGLMPLGIADLTIDEATIGAATSMDSVALEALRQGVPAARCLPLLRLLARRNVDPSLALASQTVSIAALDGRVLPITVSPCN